MAKKKHKKGHIKKSMKACATRKKGRIVPKKGFRFGKGGRCIKAKKH